jgi:hypothetical protein
MNEAQEIASLVSKIKTICYQGDGDGMESISLERWDEMTVEELRTLASECVCVDLIASPCRWISIFSRPVTGS